MVIDRMISSSVNPLRSRRARRAAFDLIVSIIAPTQNAAIIVVRLIGVPSLGLETVTVTVL